MNEIICRVVSQTEAPSITTKNGEQKAKCFLRLKALGNEYADEFICNVLGNLAQVKFDEGELVVVKLSFSVYQGNGGGWYQDVKANDIVKVKK
jgi:hypothetical protein